MMNPATDPKQDPAMDPMRKIAAAVLYEGYVLWPYRRSAIKNQQRWTFGGVYPRAFSERQRGTDPSVVQTECLVAGSAPVVEVRVRYLHVVARTVARLTPQGAYEPVDALTVGGERYLSWDEATEREVVIADLALAELADGRSTVVHVPAGSATEPLTTPDGRTVGALMRDWHALEGEVECSAHAVTGDLFKLTVRIRNVTPWSGEDRASALRQTFVSTHAVLRVAGGEFISATDPPAELKQWAATCEQVKLWPVLVGQPGERQTMLAAPIILYDYPQIAPESPGDLFDGTEIDQLLIMNILTLTDEEKAEVRATDPRTREILERSESFTAGDFMRLHGAIRDFRELRPVEGTPSFWEEMRTPGPESVTIQGAVIRAGSQVRLQPRPGGDILDLALAGQVAFVEAIEQDDEGRLHLAVTLRDDPGRDLGQQRQIGHRFFFALDEVVPLAQAARSEP